MTMNKLELYLMIFIINTRWKYCDDIEKYMSNKLNIDLIKNIRLDKVIGKIDEIKLDKKESIKKSLINLVK